MTVQPYTVRGPPARKIHLAVTALSQRGPTLSTVSVAQGGARNRSWRDRFQLYRDSNTVWLVVKGDTQAAPRFGGRKRGRTPERYDNESR